MVIDEDALVSQEAEIERRRNELISKIVTRCATAEDYKEYDELTRRMTALKQSPVAKRFKELKRRMSRYRLAG